MNSRDEIQTFVNRALEQLRYARITAQGNNWREDAQCIQMLMEELKAYDPRSK